ncbi:MAG: hypothetical protein J5I50_00975 [Chitinophagaceae bacterium]|nr:hypothetical protein [Chitinophagaceae bacterium]
MKKLFAVLAVSAFLFACNSGESTTESTETTTEQVAPEATEAPAAPAATDSAAAPAATDSAAAPAPAAQ